MFNFFGGPDIGVTGRVRTTRHDGFDTRTGGFHTSASDTDEGSVFGTFSVAIPGEHRGGTLRFTGLVGYTDLSNVLIGRGGAGRPGSADVNAMMFGGSLLWATKGGSYVVATAVGFAGQADNADRVNGFRYDYDHVGGAGNLVIGQVTSLSTDMRLDLRGSASYAGFASESYQILNLRMSSGLSVWTFAFQPMLYAERTIANGTFKPYLQGTVKQQAGYDNHLNIRLTDVGYEDIIRFDQARTYIGSELGFNYNTGKWTFGAAAYGDWSANEATYGGKVGAALKF